MKRPFHCPDCGKNLTLDTTEVEMPCLFCGSTMLVLSDRDSFKRIDLNHEQREIDRLMRDNRGVRY